MNRCVITGAASGIGLALVQALLQQSYEVIGVDVAPPPDVLQGVQGLTWLETDLSQPDALQQCSDTLSQGNVDMLVHSAGISAVGLFDALDIAAQHQVLEVNLTAPIVLTTALLASKALSQGSSIVFISSLSHFVGYPGASAYAASKDGIASYASSLSLALAAEDIHVLSVFPGPTRTPHAQRYSPDNRREAKRMPPEKVAEAILQACSTKQRLLIPGISNKMFATLGHYLPNISEEVMRQQILLKLEAASQAAQQEEA